MSISYNFNIETSLAPKEILEIAAKVNNAKINEKDPITFRATGTFAVAVKNEYDHEYTKNKWLEGYGFLPTVSTTFEQYTREGYDESLKSISRAVAALFKEIQGKAVLLYDFDTTLVQRINGKTEVNQILGTTDYDWIAEAFDEFELEYERKPLRSPLTE